MATCRPVRIPGPQGVQGTDGTDGTNGVDAYSLVAIAFNIPAQQDTVLVTLTDPAGNRWMTVGQIVAVQGAASGGAGYYSVESKTGTDQATLLNLRDDSTGAYSTNLDGIGTITVGMSISPGGTQGPPGVATAGFLVASNNLSDLDDVATARTNLGLGALATKATINNSDWSGTDLAVPNGGTGASDAATARINLGAAASGLATASGLTLSASDKVLGRTTAGPGAVEEITVTSFARTILDDTTAAAVRSTIGRVGLRYGVIGIATAVNANSVADTAVSMLSSRYRIDKLMVENASISLTTATAGLFTAAGGLGTTLAADQPLSALTASTKFDDLTLETIVTTDIRTDATLYLRVGTAQGSAATFNAWILGWTLEP